MNSEGRQKLSMSIPTCTYQQFDADFGRDVPAKGYGGWRKVELAIVPRHTAVVVMHAWDCGTKEEYPGWHRAVEYIPRADAICREVFPELLAAVRASELKLFHVVSSDINYHKNYSGYKRAVALAGPAPDPLEKIGSDPVIDELRQFKRDYSFPGAHNLADVERGRQRLGFAVNAEPQGEEGIAEDAHQLYALCRAEGVNHLIYAGFAINWCLLMSPGGMLDMSRRGLLCSALRQAVTAVENRETARQELSKKIGLWRVAMAFGFVYDVQDLLRAIRNVP